MNAPASSLGILPPPPWRLQPAFVLRQRLWAGLIPVGVVGLAFVLWEFGGQAAAIRRDEAIHVGPTVRVDATWVGKQLPGWRLTPTTTVGRVVYTEVAGERRIRALELETSSGFATNTPLHVFYDPNEPSRWTTNWSIEQATNRWFASAKRLVVFGTGVLVLLWLGLRAVAQLRLARLVAREGVERVGVFEQATPTHRKGRLFATRYRVLVPDPDGQPRRITVWYPAHQGRPLFLPNDCVLLLVAERHGMRAQVLRHDLWPLQLADADLARACDILKLIDPTAGWRVAGGKGCLRLTCSLKAGPRGAHVTRA